MVPRKLVVMARSSSLMQIFWQSYLDGLFPSLEAGLIHLVQVQQEVIADLQNRTASPLSGLDNRCTINSAVESERQREHFLASLEEYSTEERERRNNLQDEALRERVHETLRRTDTQKWQAEYQNDPTPPSREA